MIAVQNTFREFVTKTLGMTYYLIVGTAMGNNTRLCFEANRTNGKGVQAACTVEVHPNWKDGSTLFEICVASYDKAGKRRANSYSLELPPEATDALRKTLGGMYAHVAMAEMPGTRKMD